MPAQGSARKPATKPGSQSALRQRNSQLIVDALARRGPTTQARLARVTGLSTGTVSNLVKLMERRGVISSTPTIDSGRRALAIALKAGGRVVAGVDIDRTSLRVVLCGFDQTVLAEESLVLDRGHSAEDTLRRTATLLDTALGSAGLTMERLAGVGLSVAAALELDSSLPGPDPLLPNWEGAAITTVAQRCLGLPCHVDNDANLGALAQVAFGPFKDVAHLAFVKLGIGVGAGLIIDHRVVRGAHGTAGEIGHTPLLLHGDLCRCGNRGCLETVASTANIAAEIGRGLRARRPLDEAAVIDLARRRDQVALRVLDEAGYSVGLALGALANVVNPTAIVIGGALAPIGAPLLDPIYRAFHRQGMAAITSRTVLAANQLGDRTEALGAAALAMANASIP